jgi:hypothetical protein
MENKVCENCGLPSWAVNGSGRSVQMEMKAENRYQRTHRRTVWCHSDECAIQCLAISKYGRASNRWPITLAQFRATNPLGQTVSGPTKRCRASRIAKNLVWAMPTTKISNTAPLDSVG